MGKNRRKEGEEYKLNSIPEYEGDFSDEQKRLLNLINKEEKTPEEKEEIKSLNQKIFLYVDKVKEETSDILNKEIDQNLLGQGQDNLVYLYNSNYVVKFLNKNTIDEIDKSVLEFFRKKYHILKKFIGKEIPTSYFFLGETVNKKHLKYSQLGDYQIVYNTIYTCQKRIKGFTLSDMPVDTKQQKREQVEKLHRKYIDLKLLISHGEAIHGLDFGSFNIKMDLGEISKRYKLGEDFDIRKFNSPNIMYDVEKDRMYLVDFDVGKRKPEFQQLYDWLMNLSPEKAEEIIKARREAYEHHFLTAENGKKINKKYLREIYKKYIKGKNIKS